MTKPLILVTNDDGIMAPGLSVLAHSMLQLGEVVVVAPDKPQSGMGHAITVSNPLRLEKLHYSNGSPLKNIEQLFTCSGTPVDCVKLAIDKVLNRKPDLLVSGMNHGSNSSINVIYSGTMSAALEGAIERIPSIGFSYLSHSFDADLSLAAKYAAIIAKQVLKNNLPIGTCLNVNIPVVDQATLKGVRICRQSKAYWSDEYDERTDPNNRNYYWLTGVLENFDLSEDTDEWALKNNYISIVPVQADLTAHNAIFQLKNWNFND
ncbi:MAG: 5'/3'-nucleotidase SurE [Bacteroidales bacterium]|nr:5'/3'-nucleotidase SurE [Bacteroidales bacterium]